MAVTIDVGAKETTHPLDKKTVGVRLAMAARRLAYGHELEYSGPAYVYHTAVNGRVTIMFRHVGRGLIAKGSGTLKGFMIAGADGKFVPANASIDKDNVIVWSRAVANPTAVRYAWSNWPDGANLYNKDGLPASPFRTDGERK
jgi:sialate O-acetylesterase